MAINWYEVPKPALDSNTPSKLNYPPFLYTEAAAKQINHGFDPYAKHDGRWGLFAIAGSNLKYSQASDPTGSNLNDFKQRQCRVITTTFYKLVWDM